MVPDEYFQTHFALSQADANKLHLQYYKSYGLAIEGLVRHHKVDPLEYNRKVDDALPLERVLTPDPALRTLLQDLDRTKIKPWLFTNAYVTHGRRVVRLLNIEDQFEGITYCDYGADKFVCKPNREMYEKAMREAGAESVEDCFFVDDSSLNVKAAEALGWTAVHLVESSEAIPPEPVVKHQIRSLQELRELFPHFFSSRA